MKTENALHTLFEENHRNPRRVYTGCWSWKAVSDVFPYASLKISVNVIGKCDYKCNRKDNSSGDNV